MNRQYLLIPEVVHLKESAALAQEFGAAFEYNDFARPAVYEDRAETEKRIKAYCTLERDRSRDTMHGAFLDVTWASPDSVVKNRGRQLVEMSMDAAQRLGVRGVVFHTGLIGGLEIDSYIGPWLEESDIFWHRTMERFPGIHVYMENTFEHTPRMLLALRERMQDVKEFGLCLDYGHAILTGTPIETWVQQMHPYVDHIHLNDNDGRDDLHLVPGRGCIDFIKCKGFLERELKDIPVLLELNGLENQRQALTYMKNL